MLDFTPHQSTNDTVDFLNINLSYDIIVLFFTPNLSTNYTVDFLIINISYGPIVLDFTPHQSPNDTVSFFLSFLFNLYVTYIINNFQTLICH